MIAVVKKTLYNARVSNVGLERAAACKARGIVMAARP